MHCVTLLQKIICTYIRQYIALLFYILPRSEQKCVCRKYNEKQ